MTGNAGFLVLEARFVAGCYGGAEWPPSPFRLLQAMVAGLRTVDHPGLRWFESQPPPQILAEPEPTAARFKRSVPNNADPSKPNAVFTLRHVARRQVTAPVRYFFALPPGTTADQLAPALEAAHAVHTLGLGEDMCVIQGLVSSFGPQSATGMQCWTPMPGESGRIRHPGDNQLTVPVVGSLHSLEARFQAFQRRLMQSEEGFGRTVLAPARHSHVAYRTSAELPRWAVVPLRLAQPGQADKLVRFHAEHAVVVGGMLRHAAMRLAGSGPQADFAAGYGPATDPDRRLSWIPLPSIGHHHVDGMVRRALLLARAVDLPHFSQLLQALPGADGLPLVDEHTGECVAVAQPVDGAEEAVLGQYLEPATAWRTVTPMIMPGDFAGNQRLLNRLLLKSLREAGVDPGLLQHAEFSKEAFGRPAVRIRDLKLKEWKARHLVIYHVRLRFSLPIRGPLVLGRGRHYGVGLFGADLE